MMEEMQIKIAERIKLANQKVGSGEGLSPSEHYLLSIVMWLASCEDDKELRKTAVFVNNIM